MRVKMISTLRTSLMTLAILAISVPAQFGVNNAYAEKNYLRISRAMIGKSQDIVIGLNKSMVIDLPADAHDILVANPEIADAITRTSRRIYVFAKQVGETNIFVFDANGKQLLSIELAIERDTAGLQAFLKKYIRGSDIKVEIMNDNIILTGTVSTPLASARAVQLANVFLTGGEATTGQYDSGDSGGSTSGGVSISIGGDDEEARQTSAIVNLLTIDGEDQVMLKVTIAEIQRTIVKQLGIDLSSTMATGNLLSSVITDNPFGLGKPTSGSQAALGWSSGGKSISGVLRALDQTGVMRTLAEPTLTAREMP